MHEDSIFVFHAHYKRKAQRRQSRRVLMSQKIQSPTFREMRLPHLFWLDSFAKSDGH
jgi:hypothetical protein